LSHKDMSQGEVGESAWWGRETIKVCCHVIKGDKGLFTPLALNALPAFGFYWVRG
jgi:hypothetical protein